MLVNDYNIEPIYIQLSQYTITSKEFIPEGLLYYFVLDDEIIKKFLIEAFTILITLELFINKLEN